MNTVLQNPYLLHEIFEWLQWTFFSTETSSLRLSYYNASLVCRSFRGPAQTLLWRHLDSIFPLLCLLPTFQKDTGAHGPSWALNGPIGPEDARRLLLFGSRVHLIKSIIPPHNQAVIDPSVPVLVASCLEGKQLFPNLRRFRFPLDTAVASLSILHLLHSPLLRSVSFSHLRVHYLSVRDISVFLQQRSRSSPHLLTRLSIALTNQTVIDLIPCFQNLTWLQFQTDHEAVVNRDLLVSLSNMENLSYLCLKTHNLTVTPENLAPRRLRFGKLKTLVLSCPFEQSPKIFGAIDLPVLHHLSYHFVLPSSPHRYTFAWDSLFNAIAGAAPPSTLQELTLRPAHWGIPLIFSLSNYNKFAFHYPGVPFESFSTSLLQFQLTALSLDFPLLSSLSTDDLQFMIGAWPSLRLLHLRCATESTVDLSALITIAVFLPMLDNLTIDVNLNQLNTVDLEPLQTLITHGLLHLTLRISQCDNCHRKLNAMAFLLNSLFPYLRTVETVTGFEECDMTLSEQVKTLQTTGLYERRRFGIEGPFGPLEAELTDEEDIEEEEMEADKDSGEW